MTNFKFNEKRLLILAKKHCLTINDRKLMKGLLYEFNQVLPKQIAKFEKLDFSQHKPKYLPDFIQYQEDALRADILLKKKVTFQTIFRSNNKNDVVDNYIFLNLKRKISKSS